MARLIQPLKDTQCASAKPKEREYTLQDGNGLYLRIRESGAKTWMYRYLNKRNNERVKITLGSYPALTLAKARLQRGEFESMLANGLDPKEQLAILKAKIDNAHTLVNVTNEWLDAYARKKPLSDESKHKRLRKFENHLFNKFHDNLIDEVKLSDLKGALNKIYELSPDNAQRIRADLISIFSYAVP
ncbi:integrase arm-type DNA-binding domain-containing protein [Acinetobacter ursingii]|uniref:integrase arm-type DNA-binding domain-containing protein n=1 Tax=Acinetobacter ursingii TaxID=108980 RepID=UPI00300999DF